jgi:hypothetical protein
MGMTLAGVLATSGLAGLVVASSASAAVPVFPDNLIVFPNRDFVSILGYADHANETATVRVTRPGVGVVGSATGVVSGGDVAFEVNHPGGVCWGNGTGLNVTPDIQPRDVVTISFGPKGETLAGDTTAQDTFVTEKSVLGGATLDTLTVRGHIGADVDPANTEQRIIEPNLTATTVGRRDIRALPGPMTRAAKGGYSSSLEFTGDTFLATYVFDDPAVAKIAADASLGERMLSWQFVDGAANRQALTIAERGEPGGPGMGGCPNGPLQSGPVGPTDVTAVNVSGGMKLNWTPAVAVAGTPAITGYRATAVARTVNGNNEQVEMGRRIAGVGATGTTITGLSSSETYDVEVVSVSSVGLTFPPVKTDVVTDVTPPTVNASVSGGSYPAAQKVTLSANEPGSDIYYTTDGSDPVLGDVASATAVHYSGPLTISADTTLKYVAFDLANNVSTIGEQVYKITIVAVAPVPTSPAFTTTSAGEGSVTLSWADSDTSITGYEVQAYDSAGTAKVGNPYPTSLSTIKITDLPTDVAYTFGVVAINANGRSAESAKSGPLTPLGAVVAVAGPDQTIVRKTTATTVSLTGDGSTATGATYDWAQVLNGASDPDKVVLTGATTLTPRFTLELFKYPMTNKPRTFRLTVKSASGTKSDDVVVNVTPDQVSIVTAKWKAGDFRVTGAGSVTGGTITVHPGSLAAGTIPAWEAPMTAAAAPATGGVFDLRLKNGATPPRPTTVWIESSLGGTSGPFTVG